MRTLLTVTGVAIGVASITSILALAGGVTSAISSQVSDLDGNIALVRSGAPTRDSLATLANPTTKQPHATTTLTEKDLATTKNTDGVEFAAPIMVVSGAVKSGVDAERVAPQSTIIATTPDLDEVVKLPVRDGQFIDGSTSENTAVIGHQLSIDLFGTDRPIGQTFTIKDHRFTIIGVLKPLNNPLNYNAIDFDYAAIISLTSGKSLYHNVANISQINFAAASAAELPAVTKAVDSALLKDHHDERDFTLLSGDEIAEPKSELFRAVAAVMSIIAAISLVVGGVGVMNIMLVSVAERTREIGLRKSVGASNQDIIWQFMIEALAMSLVGGVLGYVGGYVIAFAASTSLPFTPVFTWEILATAFGLALIVGCVFGIYPAAKAARKDPIESLRNYH